MFKPFEFCIPTRSTIVPSGPDWLHEIKYDGYRLWLERDGSRIQSVAFVWRCGTLEPKPFRFMISFSNSSGRDLK
jgi:hypothetical protein